MRRSSRRRSIDSNLGPEFDSDSDENPTEHEIWCEKEPEFPVISNEGYYWNGKDYANSFIEDFKDLTDFSSDQFDRTETARMPWRDEAFVVFGHSARDLARHFIQRWNQTKVINQTRLIYRLNFIYDLNFLQREKVKINDSFPYLLPKSYTEEFVYNHNWFTDTLYSCNVQFTRSLDTWSGGICQTETSIAEAYRDLIQKAEHFIYIEVRYYLRENLVVCLYL